jgi:hypothetical protein
MGIKEPRPCFIAASTAPMRGRPPGPQRPDSVREKIPRLPGGRFKPDSVREKIRAAQLINRLQAHIFDGLELSMSQVRAIEILLRKSVPDLTKTEVQADATHRYVVQLPEVLSREEWLAKYGEGQITLQ